MLDRMTAGVVPDKPHTALRDASGTLRHEECLTRDGFDGPFTILYHEHRPHTAALAVATHGWEIPSPSDEQRRPLARRHYRTQELPRRGGAPVDARVPLLFNDDVVLAVLHPDAPDPVYLANGDGDDLFFVLDGGGALHTQLGDLTFGKNDYVFVPKGLLHRFVPSAGPQHWLSIECLSGFGLPKPFRNEVGQLRMDAPYTHRDFRRPGFAGPRDEAIRDLVVKRGGAFHGFRYDHAPLDVVGWDGAVYPWAFDILRFQPRVGLIHLPPTVHATFAAKGALICSFVPRPLDFHPDAIPCPYPHSSVGCDEFIFYCGGDFTSRRGVGAGSVSHHPAGVIHGPHPGAYEASLGARATNEIAVMLDTTKPLISTAACRSVEDGAYHQSFR
ncbi:MAG TPA: homogentisate 1,2-dioxygenase [Polyangia bacterium]|jgi:homogentisate 1,2-dioxygenase|nr:homogentisate 1,2-dioxygenase [Polyangia bacterium]